MSEIEITRNNKGQFLKGFSSYRKYLTIKNCLKCKTSFQPKQNISKFCSKQCYWNNLKDKTSWNKGIPMSENAKQILREARMGVRNNTGRTHFKKGLIPWNYKGGITEVSKLIKGSPAYKFWRASVFKRDKWSCVECKYRSHKRGDIQADHIKPFALFPESRLDINNGRTLCIPCHSKTPSYKNNKIKVSDYHNMNLQNA